MMASILPSARKRSPASIFSPATVPPQLPGGTTPPVTSGCGSGGGGVTGGSADLFPCDSTWYKDVSSLGAASESAAIVSAIQAGGGWGLGNKLQIGMGYALIH